MAGGDDEADPAAARDMAALYKDREEELGRPEETEWPAWSGYLQDAWGELVDDRHIGSMGGLGKIWFSSIKAYAEQFGIVGSEFNDFLTFIRAIDGEYLDIMRERAKAEAEKRKNGN